MDAMKERMKLYGYSLQEHHDEIFKQKNKKDAPVKVEEKKVDRSVNSSRISVESKPPPVKRNSAPVEKKEEINR
jgi:hypothetical protein